MTTLVCCDGRMVELLIDHGADTDHRTDTGRTA